MSKQCYGLAINKNGVDWVKELASTEEYERYCSYLIWLARQWNLKSVEQFIQYYYGLYYNPEWKPNEQYYQGNRSLEKEPFFDAELDEDIRAFPYRVQAQAHMSGEDSYGYYPVKVNLNGELSRVFNKVTGCYVYNCVTISHVIKPQEIWKRFSGNNTFEKHMTAKKYGYTLASMNWWYRY